MFSTARLNTTLHRHPKRKKLVKFDVRQGSKLNSYLLSEEGWVVSSLVRSFVTGMTPNFNSYTRSNSVTRDTWLSFVFNPSGGERRGFRSSLSISGSHARSPTFRREKLATFRVSIEEKGATIRRKLPVTNLQRFDGASQDRLQKKKKKGRERRK